MGDVRTAQVREDGDDIMLTIVLSNRDPAVRRRTPGKREARSLTISRLDAELDTPPQRASGSQKTTPLRQTVMAKPKQDVASASIASNPSSSTGSPLDHKSAKLRSSALLAELADQGQGRPEVVLGLLDQGADVNHLSKDQLRPLYLAALHGRHKCMPLLIDAGAKVNDRCAKSETALHAAVRANCNGQECARLLLDAGADPNIRSARNYTPYALAGKLPFGQGPKKDKRWRQGGGYATNNEKEVEEMCRWG